MNRTRQCFCFILLALLTTSCSLIGGSGLGVAACPTLKPNVDALSARLSANARVDGKVKAFVQASKDMARISAQMEAEAADACRRMGVDLGLAPQHMKPEDGPGGAAAGACKAVAARIDGILRGGIGGAHVSLRVTIQPPVCQANVQAQARCDGACAGSAQASQADAECRASCKAHADAHASCQPARVQVEATSGAHVAGRLVATLRANLPRLVHAQIALGQRMVQNARVIAEVGVQLPKIVGEAGAQALACIAAAADMAASASVRINVSVRASASVTGRVSSG